MDSLESEETASMHAGSSDGMASHTAQVIVFPGVGSFGNAMETLNAKGFTEPLKDYIKKDRPFFGICLGMQVR